MTKKDLIARLANASDLSQAVAKRWLDTLTGLIQDGLLRDRQVNLPGLGRLSVKQRPARVGCNPRSGMKITIPERQAVVFKPSKRLLDQLNTREAEKKTGT